MRLLISSVFDVVSEVYSPPMLHRTVGEASRAFLDACGNPQTFVGRNPTDMKLYHLGYFDDTTGSFESLNPPVFVCHGVPAGYNPAEIPTPIEPAAGKSDISEG